MRLHAKRGPDPMDGGMRKAAVGSHRADGQCVASLGMVFTYARRREQPGHRRQFAVDRHDIICQPFNTILYEPTAPLANRVLVNTQAFGNVFALQTLRA